MDEFSDAVSITAVSTKHKSDEHLLLLHRRLRRESGHLTKRQEPRLEIALVFLFTEITFSIEDAREYVYSISSTKRVRVWRDIEVKLYI